MKEGMQCPSGGSKLLRIALEAESRAASCRFKVWQPHHSGAARDVWSIDDFYIGPALADSLSFNASAASAAASGFPFIGHVTLGEFCNRSDVVIMRSDADHEVDTPVIHLVVVYSSSL